MSRANKHGKSARSKGHHNSAPRLDAANLAGITTLMNPQNIKTGANLEEAEKTVMGKTTGNNNRVERDPVRVYNAELNQLAEELGFDFLDDGDAGVDEAPKTRPLGGASSSGDTASKTRTAVRPPVNSHFVTSLIDEIDLDGDVSEKSYASRRSRRSNRSNRSNRSHRSASSQSSVSSIFATSKHKSYNDSEDDSNDSDDCDCDSDCEEDCDCDCHFEDESSDNESGNEDDEKVDLIISQLEKDLGIKTDGHRERRRNRIRGGSGVPIAEHRHRSRGTEEQERRRHINSVVSDIRGETRTTFGVERERMQDLKASKLEQIGQLRMTLEEEGIDCDGVTTPTSESAIEEIDSVLNILRLKNDRNRYSSLAEEVILGVAEGVETVFDGSRPIPLVGWRPDYTGYHNTVNVKLHRMRFETSQIVGNIIQKHNVGPTARIVMELLPSFFLYPRQQKKQRGTPGLSSDPHVSDARSALSAIRESDRHKSLDDVRNI